MNKNKTLIVIFITVISYILFQYKIMGDMMIFPFLISLLYLITSIGFQSSLYLAKNNSFGTKLIGVLNIIIFFFIVIWFIFFVDIETCRYVFLDAKCELENRIFMIFIISCGTTLITLSLSVLVHKILIFIKKDEE